MSKQKFNINNSTRLDYDECAIKNLENNNQKINDYTFDGHLPNFNAASRENYFDSFNQPGVYQSNNYAGYSSSINIGSNIKDGSSGNIITHDKSKRQLDSADHLNPPFKGPNQTMALDPDTMSKLYSGELTRDKTSMRGKELDRFTPLLPEIETQIQNPKNLIPTYWVRGGMDTKVVVRNIDYLKTCGLKK